MRVIGKTDGPTTLPQMRDLPITFVHETVRTPDWALASHPKLSWSRDSLGLEKNILGPLSLQRAFCRLFNYIHQKYTIQHTSFTWIFIWVRKLDSNIFTKTKDWSGRNEVTETSGRLHPLWPQNKWIHTPRTTDYRHTRQDRRIQTELAFTLAKNVTKPNPFEIIPLQTTRKENNWKTEETLARAAVTLETELIKGSNPWCLWWWQTRAHIYVI